MSELRTHRPTRFLYRLVNLSGLLVCAYLVGILGAGAIGVAGKEVIAVTASRTVSIDRPADLPSNVHAGELPVRVDVDDPERADFAFAALRDGLKAGAVLLALWLVHGLLKSALSGSPFAMDNVRRLRRLGAVMFFGAPIVSTVGDRIDSVLAERAGFNEGAAAVSVTGELVLLGLGMFVLAQVFAHGVALREDVEGTV